MAEIPAEQRQHREAFGRALTAWMRINGWSQQTIHDLAQELGPHGPHNSQVSLAQRGILDPKPLWFVSLAAFNKAIAEQKLPPGLSRKLRDRFIDSKPYLMDDGQLATASDFFAVFVGEISPPQALTTAPGFSAAQAEQACEALRKGFRQRARAEMLSPAAAWDDLEVHLKNARLTKQERDHLREMLSGWTDCTPEELGLLYGRITAGFSSWGAHF